MHRDRMNQLGSILWNQVGLTPYQPKTRGHEIHFGFDTEFYRDDKGIAHLLTWQLSYSLKHTKIFTEPLSWDSLYTRSLEMAKEAGVKIKDVTLFTYVVFFGTAEAQWLDWQGARMYLFGGGRMNLRHPVSKKRSMLIYDISNFYAGHSLGKVAATHGLHKLKYRVDNLTPESIKDPKFRRYAANDAYITVEVFKKLRESESVESGIDILLTRTPSTTGAADFRARNIDEHFGQHNTCLRRYALLSDWGGVQQCYFRGYKRMTYEYDAVSMYPMTAYNMGILPLEKDWEEPTIDLKTYLSGKGGLGSVLFTFPEGTKYPCLPVSTPTAKGDRVTYPLKGKSYCTLFEVKQAIAMGAKITVLKGYYYKSGTTKFGEYLKGLVDKKESAPNEVERTRIKLKLVSVIGKTTQKIQAYDLNEVKKLADEKEIPTETVMTTIWDPPTMEKLKKVSIGSMFYPEWHSLIMGAYRANFWKTIAKTNALMAMTDAIFTETDLGDSFTQDGITYKLQNMGDFLAYKAGLFRQGKSYRFERYDKEVSKYLQGKVLRHRVKPYTKERITTPRQAFRGLGNLGDTYTIRKSHVSLNYDTYMRALLPDGNTVPLDRCCASP